MAKSLHHTWSYLSVNAHNVLRAKSENHRCAVKVVRALQLTADVSPVDSLHDRPIPEPLELDDYFFDDDDVTPTEFSSVNQGTEVKIKFEDDELVF